jgi:uncharacterized protein YbcC (UPF0753/DUF2309 family)
MRAPERFTIMTPSSPLSVSLRAAIDAACDRIAPTWPLDQFIAVNPYWGWRGAPVSEAAAHLGVLAGTTLTMPRAWFHDEWAAGRLDEAHVRAVAAELGAEHLPDDALAVLHAGTAVQPDVAKLPLITDLRDLGTPPVPGRTWTDTVVHQIGQHCAGRFDEWQASWAPNDDRALFASWRIDPMVTHGVAWHEGRAAVRARLDSLPTSAEDAIAVMLDDLGIDHDCHEWYLTAVLASVNGWAAWCAYRRWQARLVGDDDDAIVELLAIRLGWEWLLAAELGATLLDWASSWRRVDDHAASTIDAQRVDWLLQTALERTHQDTIARGLPHAQSPSGAADVQAVFCIDVRSEVIRRALEAEDPAVQTRGFAGFFGLPIAYSPAGTSFSRPQLPGLLAPALQATDEAGSSSDATAIERRSERLERGRPWLDFRRGPSSMFTYVETTGLVAAAELVHESLPHHHRPTRWELDGLGAAASTVRPRLAMLDDDPAGAAALAHRVLGAMGLRHGFAPLVLLCGHGSSTANNPHAAGLDCGACGGQTGEVNARALADVLNHPVVRHELALLGTVVPTTTWFVAGLHDTTTDHVTLFDTDLAPADQADRIERLRARLRSAGERARAERAPSLGLGALTSDPQTLERRIVERSTDWSQVRPEWGLAGNAAFVVAPRWRTRHLDLGGRCFLHDYDWRADPDLSVLTLIMTAPMVVTNWINLQYHASTVDNRRYGSGDKVLHNVVGGRLGVFEGNGGDLRIGLSMQSLHDGRTLRHRPLRLSVFIEAPRASIDRIVADHVVVQQLVSNGWLHLLRIEPHTGEVERRATHGWVAAPLAP